MPPFWDYSQALEEDGIRIRFAAAGKYKAAGAFPELSMTNEQFQEFQRVVEEKHALFKAAVSAKRSDIVATDMQGQCYDGLDGLRRGFADLIIDDREQFNPAI